MSAAGDAAADAAAVYELRRIARLFTDGDGDAWVLQAEALHRDQGVRFVRACEVVGDRILRRWDRG